MASDSARLLGNSSARPSYTQQDGPGKFDLLQPQSKIELAFEHLCFKVPDRNNPTEEKTIIHDMSGYMPAASMTAIMGPSGCGKTTLMDMVANVKTMPYTGSVYVNGEPRRDSSGEVHGMRDAFQGAMGYVSQCDDANGFCTVHETLMFHALLRPPALSAKASDCVLRWTSHGMDILGVDVEFGRARTALTLPDKEPLTTFDANRVIQYTVVDLVLGMLSLEEVKDQKIGNVLLRGISGGQKKRMSIGRVLVSCPSIVFLDEPTTGLSSTDSMTVMDNMKLLVNELGITVVAVIHQPRNEVFHAFERLMLMVDGRLAYQGLTTDAAQYFTDLGFEPDEHSNPADFFIDCISEDTLVEVGSGENKGVNPAAPDMFASVYEHGDDGVHQISLQTSIDKELKSKYMLPGRLTSIRTDGSIHQSSEHLSTWFRFKVLFKREWNVYLRDPYRLTGRVANGTVLGLLIGLLYTDIDVSQLGNWTLINLELPALSSMVTMPVFFIDRPFMNMERSAGLYHTLPYYLAQFCTSMLAGMLGNFMIVFVSFCFSGLPWEVFLGTYACALTTFFAFEAFISVSAYFSKNQTQALGMFNSTTGVFLLFNGLTANPRISPAAISWICYGSPLYYGIETVLSYYSESDGFNDGDQAIIKGILVGDQLGQLGMSEGNIARNIMIVLSIGISMRSLGWYLCDTKNKVVR